jgi:hypothetical protein
MDAYDVSFLAGPGALPDPESLAVGLLQQTRVGRRQWTTAQVLAAAPVPVPPARLMAEVAARAGRGCYGTKPAYTLQADIHALKQAGLPVRYSRAQGRSGYYLPDAAAGARRRAAILLRRAGWHPSDWQQIGVYAQMPPARKVAQMFRLRHAFMEQLRARLRAEHPAAGEHEIAALVLRELADVREPVPGE